jgi:hypothetical protein
MSGIAKSFKVAGAILEILFGLFSYLRLALQLFWGEYGQQIQVGLAILVLYLFGLSGRTFEFGKRTRKAFDSYLTKRLDSAFFRLIDIQ